MFTGLVETVGTITSVERTKSGIRLSIKPLSEMEVHIGDSISVNGVCLTVIEDNGELVFDVSPETMRSTNLGELQINDKVNLEQALRLSDRLGGHIVTGHVDGVGSIIDKRQEGEYTFYTFEAPREILKYIVKKGSVAVDGISLTVIGLDNRSFSVAIIPHTLAVTNIGDKGIGDKVNLEVDIIGKYVEKFMTQGNIDDDQRLMKLLKEKGFTK
jgi:riboflavin synthase